MEETQVQGSGGTKSVHSVLHNITQKLASVPGFRRLLALAYRAAAVAESPGRLFVQASPARLPPVKTCQGLTVISTNLWHDWPKHRRIVERLEAFAAMIEEHKADILLLQEVSRTTSFWADQWLANRLGMGYVYSRANGHLGGIGFEEGLAIFSRHPIEQPVLRQLSPASNRFVHRLALGAQIASPYGRLMAFSVHLSLIGKQNARQTAHLSAWVRELSEKMTALVGGDFNAGEGSQQIKRLQTDWLDTFRHLNQFADGATHELRWPWGQSLRRSRLDYIFLKARHDGWRIVEARHLETRGEQHSDHRAVLLRLASRDATASPV
jgi:endonuclease/exonuclease/phosphatase family metal-dependent hydrolase